MATTTNYSWTTPDDTALVKDGAAAIRSLGTAIDTTVFNNAGAAIAKTIVDAKGDLIVATAADTVARLASSASNGDLLTVDTSTASGLKWAAPAAAGGMTLISETVASGLSSLSLSSIPGTYKQLLLIWSGIYHSTTGSNFVIRFNNSSSTYWGNGHGGVGTSNAAFGYNETSINKNLAGLEISPFGTSANFSTTDNNAQANGMLLIDNYASTTKYKHFETSYGFYNNVSPAYCSIRFNAANSDTAAITSIDVVRASGSATFTNRTDTSIRLYGLS